MANGIEQTNGKKVEGFRCILTPKSSKLIEVEMIDELFSFPLKLSIDVMEIWSNFYWLNVASQKGIVMFPSQDRASPHLHSPSIQNSPMTSHSTSLH